ncbi:NfeD family protein [Phreatobacter sp. AB_2022a]|uniref:NfeD family protein n=1 Tax=Phreatobacter sp. AB_2022a TaxID=3003134 RepID=UPI002286F5E4|nr:NfeD family protein [Phreatobacter sp. AB_2022a]MCZ0734716.1 NfeD family protein [Phreatobacter sp. AB_2022a]
MIIDSFAALGAWGWIALAAVLLVAEIVAPGYFLVWLGAAAAATGLIFLILPGAGWQWQTGVFAVLALASVIGWFRFAWNRKAEESDQPLLNRRLESLVGREFVIDEPIQSGRGRLRVGDSVWAATGPDCPSGTRVRVSGIEGTTLVVEPV